MSYRIKISDGGATVELYERQKRPLVETVQILRELAPYQVIDTELISPLVLAEIERLVDGRPLETGGDEE